MSYDLTVFDPNAVENEVEAFWEWLETLEEEYDDEEDGDLIIPSGMSSNLLAFYNALRQKYPPLNGPNSDRDTVNEDNEFLTDYYFSEHSIELGFRWGVSDDARRDVVDTAIKTGVGVFLNSDGDDPAFTRRDLEVLRGTL